MGAASSRTTLVIDPDGLEMLIRALQDAGFRTYGPRVEDSAVRMAPISTAADMPVGVGDEAGPGRYRLTERGDGAFFGFAVPADSCKPFLFPPSQVLFQAVRDEDGIRFEPAEPPPPKRAFIGVRGCDLAAIAITDEVFRHHAWPDPHYVARREQVFLVAVDCANPAGTCFCASMGTGPAAGPGADLVLTELHPGTSEHRFLVRVESDAGAQIVDAVPNRPAQPADLAAAQQQHADAEAALTRSIAPGVWTADPEHPRWQQVADRCLSCANCTMACPTCFCFDLTDNNNPVTGGTQRSRRWGSCFERSHSYLHGGAVRTSPKSRYRQWLTHKLVTWPEQFGTAGCVGCGRCIAWCPVGIDITEETAALRSAP